MLHVVAAGGIARGDGGEHSVGQVNRDLVPVEEAGKTMQQAVAAIKPATGGKNKIR
jgi:hypothetical protein